KAGIRLKIAGPRDIKIFADPNQIKQILINLIQNAAESLESGGSVTLRASHSMERGFLPALSWSVLDVEDNGKGIAPEVEARLFQPFFSTKKGGTGLGLTIAARIMQRHGGLLRHQSRLGQGTTFSLLLPD